MEMNSMSKEADRNLKLDAALKDLKLFYTSIDIKQKVAEVLKIFRNDTQTPGIILKLERNFAGMISRRSFFEYLSRPYSRELYFNRSIQFLFEDNPDNNILILPNNMSISDATFQALQRAPDKIHEPIIIENGNDYAIIDMHQLLLAQSHIHLLTVKSLQEANDFKSEMLSIAAHDLKNPLNAILGLSKMIIDDSNDADSTKEAAGLIYNSSQRMFELIVKILDSAAIEVGKIKLKKAAVDLHNLVKSVIENNKKLAGKKGQNLIFSANGDDFFVFGDMIRIQDAIDNLISNAIKYSPFNKEIKIHIEKNNKSIWFSVADEGPGIAEDDQKMLFEKFQRLKARPTGGESSTGLGLYIVKQTIEMHQGSIWVESRFGAGSKFIFKIPVYEINKPDLYNGHLYSFK
jgi:signal transduction histidine kinase